MHRGDTTGGSSQGTPPLALVSLSLWLGLVTGLIELGGQLANQHLLGTVIRRPAWFVSTTPLTYAVIFTPTGLGFALVVATHRRLRRAATFVLLGMVGASYLSLYEYDRPTTARIERIAAEGATFEWAQAVGREAIARLRQLLPTVADSADGSGTRRGDR